MKIDPVLGNTQKKEEPRWLLRGTFFVHTTDPIVALFWLLFFISGAIFPLEMVFDLFFTEKWLLFAKSSSEAPLRHLLAPLFSEC